MVLIAQDAVESGAKCILGSLPTEESWGSSLELSILGFLICKTELITHYLQVAITQFPRVVKKD